MKEKLVAHCENSKLLPLSPFTSKAFGLQDKITTNLAYDKYQGLLAYGTQTKIIKIVSLKGYEYEIYEAHESSIRFITFVPNRGILISIDDSNEIGIWDLKDLSQDPVRVRVPSDEQTSGRPRRYISTALYTPTFLSNEVKNHGNIFIAMSNGSIFVLDWAKA